MRRFLFLCLTGLILNINPVIAKPDKRTLIQSECVILLHGLIRSPKSMNKIEKLLTAEGYTVINTGYPSTKHNIEELSKQHIPPMLKQCGEDKRIHFITHSLGGIIIRDYLSKHTIKTLGHVVMLAPPNNGSEIVDKIGNWKLFYALNGKAGQQLGTKSNDKPKSLPDANFSVGVIAGNWTIDPVGWLMLPKPNDGKVSVASTKLKGMQDFKLMPYSHAYIMKRSAVINECLHFLKHGKFSRKKISGTNFSSN